MPRLVTDRRALGDVSVTVASGILYCHMSMLALTDA